MITFSKDLSEKIAEAVRDALTRVGANEEITKYLIASTQATVQEVLKDADSDCNNKYDDTNKKLQVLENRMIEQEKEFEKLAKQTEEQRHKQAQQVDELTQKVSRLEHYFRSAEVNRVKDNVVIKSSKSKSEITEYLGETIKKGGGEKPSLHSLSIQSIIQKKSEITPGKPKKGKTAESQLFKVRLSPKQKNDLYKGLSLGSSRANSDFQVNHDTPRFLVHQKHAYEKMGYAIRSAFKGAVKTRISLRSHNLVLMIKSGESDWADLTSDQKFLDTPLVIKDGDSFPVGVKTVGDLKKTIVRF